MKYGKFLFGLPTYTKKTQKKITTSTHPTVKTKLTTKREKEELTGLKGPIPFRPDRFCN